jgi:hypothetical protein
MHFHLESRLKITGTVPLAVPWIRRLFAGHSSRRLVFDSESVHVGFVMNKVDLEQVFPCQFHSTGAPLHFKQEKINRLCYRVAQYASRLRCVRSVCCGAPHHKKDPRNSSNCDSRTTRRWVANTPSVKMLCPQTNCLSLHFRKNVTRLRVGPLRIGQTYSVSCKTVCQ